nr:zinc-finger homeodomain protein 9-like [Ipomoea batatas]
MMPSLRSMKELQEKNGIIISRVRHRSKTTRNVKISDKGMKKRTKETHNGLEHNGDGKECEEEESKEFGHGWSELKLFLRSAGNGAKSSMDLGSNNPPASNNTSSAAAAAVKGGDVQESETPAAARISAVKPFLGFDIGRVNSAPLTSDNNGSHSQNHYALHGGGDVLAANGSSSSS